MSGRFYQPVIKWLQEKCSRNYSSEISEKYYDLTPFSEHSDEPVDSKGALYSEALTWALENKNIKNIAITGPYGSGKSTVIHKFQKEAESYRKYKFLPISMALFNKDSNGGIKEGAIGNQSEDLEKGILLQIFYKNKANRMHASRFNRIIHQSFVFQLLKAMLFLTWLITLAFIFFKDFWKSVLSQVGGTVQETLLCIPGIAYIGLFAAGAVYFLARGFQFFKKRNITKLSVKDGTLELGDAAKEATLNEYLDEILYFFEVTDYNVVVFEDLDRFDNIEIFTRLRELNGIINRSDQIKQSVCFIYAIREDLFSKNEDKTKFFDFIIPIVPVINPSNSGEQLVKHIEELKNVRKPNDKFVFTVSLYVDDMRLLKNIVNEFVIFVGKIDQKDLGLNIDKLFAMVVYKNIYPQDFSKLRKSEGMVYDVFARKEKLILSLTQSIDQEIKDLESVISNLKESHIKNLEELKAIYFFNALKDSKIHIELRANNASLGNYTIKDLMKDEIFPKMKDIKDIVIRIGRERAKEEVVNQNLILNGFDDRKEIVEQYQNQQLTELNENLSGLQKTKSEIEHFSIQQIIETRGSENVFQGEILQADLLKKLIREGYIDENYHDYISIFYEGQLSKNDKKFLLSVNNQQPLEVDFALKNIENIVEKLELKDFAQTACLNIDLVDFLLKNRNQYRDQLVKVFSDFPVLVHRLPSSVLSKDIPGNERTRRLKEFLEFYIVKSKDAGNLIEWSLNSWLGFLSALAETSLLSEYVVVEYLKLVITRGGSAAYSMLQQYPEVSEYFSKHGPMIFNLPPEHNENSMALMSDLDLKIQKVDEPIQNRELFDFMYQNNHYEVNGYMVELMYRLNSSKEKYEPELYKTQNYTCILESDCEPLKKYIQDNLPEYVENVLLKLEVKQQDKEENIIDLIGRPHILGEIKEQIIQKQTTQIIDITKVQNKETWYALLRSDLLLVSWGNVIKYYSANMTSDFAYGILIDYLNRESVYTELSSIKIDEKWKNSEVLDKFFKEIIFHKDISDECFEALVDFVPKGDYFSVLADFGPRKVKHMIKCELIPLTSENFLFIKKLNEKDTKLNLHIRLVENNIKDYLENTNYTLNIDEIVTLLESKTLKPHQKNKIIWDKVDLDDLENNTKLMLLVLNIYKQAFESKEENNSQFDIDENVLSVIFKSPHMKEASVVFLQENLKHFTDEQITKLLAAWDEPLSLLVGEEQAKLDKKYIDLIKALKEKGYVSLYSIEDDHIRVNTKRV